MNDAVKNVLDKVKATAVVAGGAAGRAVDQAGKKAGELWEITKISMRINELKEEMESYYKKIGELVFQTHHDPNCDNACVDEWLVKMDEIEQEIAELREKMTDLKQVRLCPECGKKLDREDSFCRYCGKGMEE